MHNDFIIKDTPKKGKGLFATKDYNKNMILFKFEGVKIVKEDAVKHPNSAGLLQIGVDLYLDIAGHYSYFMNHSCNPNCYIKIAANTAFCLSFFPIKEGNELTFDYATTSSDDLTTWSMPCNCSIFGCRKTITGFSVLPQKQQASYIELGLVPKYLRGK